MSVKGATSANMKPAKIGSAQRHCSDVQRAKYDYINHDRTHLNVAWHKYTDKTLIKAHKEACEEYTRATGKRPDLKERTRWSARKKRMETVVGFAPIREMVVVIKSTTTEAEVDQLCLEMQRKFGMTPLAFSMHFDEGKKADKDDVQAGRAKKVGEVMPTNPHAHLFFDIMERREFDHSGKPVDKANKWGRTIKFTAVQTRMMQDVAAIVLGMERGESKETPSEHLGAMEYKAEMARREAERLEQEKRKNQKTILENGKVLAEQQKIISDNASKINAQSEKIAKNQKAISELSDAEKSLAAKRSEEEKLSVEAKKNIERIKAQGQIFETNKGILERQKNRLELVTKEVRKNEERITEQGVEVANLSSKIEAKKAELSDAQRRSEEARKRLDGMNSEADNARKKVASAEEKLQRIKAEMSGFSVDGRWQAYVAKYCPGTLESLADCIDQMWEMGMSEEQIRDAFHEGAEVTDPGMPKAVAEDLDARDGLRYNGTAAVQCRCWGGLFELIMATTIEALRSTWDTVKDFFRDHWKDTFVGRSQGQSL